ncbi:MAG: nuclear transport factor 2 family protein [Ectothiorhodospiraceae bacterium]|nr:nuclear transport factor 2 family protein [Ectothiorhodospiraceae bacterium]MCH8506958.1 nuclear transport factor 2 family protein [Ectothiorhodospiraceae bacterium]
MYASPDQAADAFYAAFAARDINAMMGVWSQRDDIICIHPMSDRLQGRDAIRQSWAALFHEAPPMQFANRRQQMALLQDAALQTLEERIVLLDRPDPGPGSPLLATNVFVPEEDGWRMLLHHASPLAADGEPRRSSRAPLH